jgi:hypothetical protein
MRVLFNGSGVSIDDRALGSAMSTVEIAAAVGPSVSDREIPMHPTGSRKVNFSESGIVWYVDYPEDQVSHLHVALSPGDTPEKPPFSFSGSARLGNFDLTPETSEEELIRNGEVSLHGHHHTWSYETVAHQIAFVFKQRRNGVGKRSGAYRLAFVSVSFKSNSEPVADRYVRP